MQNVSLFISLWALSVPVFFLIDMLWLGLVARDFYRSQLGHLMGDINWTAAIIFYLVYLVGLTFFATVPAVEKGSILTALVLGGLFGFFTYATYDLTNLSTLKDWPMMVVVVDILWGTVLGAMVASGAYWLHSLFIG